MYEGEDTVYVERDDILKLLEQQPCWDAISRAYKEGYDEGYDRGYIIGEAQADAWLVIQEHINDILDKIRAEVEQRKKNSGGEPNRDLAFNVCLQIIDKYKVESEE